MLRKLILPCIAVVAFLFGRPAESEACWWLFGCHSCCRPVCCAPPPCCQPACAPACSPCGVGGCGTGGCGPGGCGISSTNDVLFAPTVVFRAPVVRAATTPELRPAPRPRLARPAPAPVVTSTTFPASDAILIYR